MTLSDLKKKYIDLIYQEKALLIRQKQFILHHGGQSHLFINHNQFLSNYKNLKLLVDIYEKLLPGNIKSYSLGSVDSVMSPILCGLLSIQLNKNVVVTKEKKLEHGTESKVYGIVDGEIILIDDVTSTGELFINAAKILRKEGGIVRYAVVSSCRDLSAIDKLSKIGIKTLYIATYEEIIYTLWPKLKTNEKKIVLEEVQRKNYDWKLA